MFANRKPATSPKASKFSPPEAVSIFKRLDTRGVGELSTQEFVKNLKDSQDLATKLGMPERLRRETSLRDSYQLIFGSIECNQATTINVNHPKIVVPCYLF